MCLETILDHVDFPKDLKKLNIDQLNQLAKEIRKYLLEHLSKTGGHLASNLGVTELTIALHYVFQSPIDKIIWDVGHQSYVHKMLTGRKTRFKTLRQTKGMSGFPKRTESKHDIFETGHASTSISAALGIARARDLSEEDYNVISVIGDGSLTGGMAFEALNDAGHTGTKLVVILNDNQMSIDMNVGGLSKYLNTLRTEPRYLEIKDDVNKILKKIPKIGETVRKTVEKAKDSVKQFMIPGMFFDELGFNYVGPVDGHDLESLISVLQRVKYMNGPILIHVYTTKGRGYKIAENNPAGYHGVASFDIQTGESYAKKAEDFSAVFGRKIVELAKMDDKIVAVTAAMPTGTGLVPFMNEFPKRFFDVGIAEQHAVTMCAGLASNGYRPILAVYSTFLQRAYDQVLHDVCIQNLPVIFAVDRAGIVGADGETHQGVFDISYLAHIPNITILAPKDARELEKMIEFAFQFKGPVAIRYPRGNAYDLEQYSPEPIIYAKGEILEQGENIAVFALGSMMKLGAKIVKNLKEKNIQVTLINPRFIKPLDIELLLEIANTHKKIITIEDHVKIGGFGSQVLEILNEHNVQDVEVFRFGWEDEFIPHGSVEDLYKAQGLTLEDITVKICEMME